MSYFDSCHQKLTDVNLLQCATRFIKLDERKTKDLAEFK